MLAAEEQFAVDNEAGYAEDTCFEDLRLNTIVVRPARAGVVCSKSLHVGARFREYAFDHGGIFDIEFALPERVVHPIDVTAQGFASLQLRPLHADPGER